MKPSSIAWKPNKDEIPSPSGIIHEDTSECPEGWGDVNQLLTLPEASVMEMEQIAWERNGLATWVRNSWSMRKEGCGDLAVALEIVEKCFEGIIKQIKDNVTGARPLGGVGR